MFGFKQSLELARKNFTEVKLAFSKPIIFEESTAKLINSGIAYIFGRDNRFRPIFVVNLKLLYFSILNKRLDDDTLKILAYKYLFYAEEKLLIKGRVETAVFFVDCEGTNLC